MARHDCLVEGLLLFVCLDAGALSVQAVDLRMCRAVCTRGRDVRSSVVAPLGVLHEVAQREAHVLRVEHYGVAVAELEERQI